MNSFVARYRGNDTLPVELAVRMRFNPNLEQERFGAVMAIINNITLLAIVLTGSALIREREHGTIEHLLVMPVTPFEIMLAKIWSMGLVVLVVSGLSLLLMVQGVLQVPIEGSIPLFMLGVALSLFATTSIGIFMGTIARSMPQLGLLMILVLLPRDAVWRLDPAGKHAAGGAGYYVNHADHAFCQRRRRFCIGG